MIIGIDHIQLAMPEGREDLAREFYGTLLELNEVPKLAELAKRGGVWFERGAVKIHLGVEAAFRPAKKAHPGLLVQDLSRLAQRLKQAGVEVIEDGLLPGYQRIFVADPFGNRLELLEPLPQG